MAAGTATGKPQNVLLVGLLALITLFTAFHEGFLSSISVLFWITLIGALCLATWLALTVSTRRLLSLILAIFFIEYVKESIGIRSGMWSYHGVDGQFNLGVWAWVLGGLAVYTLSTRVVIRQIRRLKFSLPRLVHAVLIVLISSLIPLTLGPYWSAAGALFFSFYGLLLAAGIYAVVQVDSPIFAGIVITAWAVANPSEYVGSVSSGTWTFTHNPHYPPLFLLFGCWPLEILAQYTLSAFLAGESMSEGTF